LRRKIEHFFSINKRKSALREWQSISLELVRRLGIEPRTHGLKGRCSTELSYRLAPQAGKRQRICHSPAMVSKQTKPPSCDRAASDQQHHRRQSNQPHPAFSFLKASRDLRHEIDSPVAIERIRDCGAVITTVESAVFELLRQGGTEQFRQIPPLFK
jgi:hypothetical protein